MNPLSDLERLVAAIEHQGANIAPTYQEYMPIAFATATISVLQGVDCSASEFALPHPSSPSSELHSSSPSSELHSS